MGVCEVKFFDRTNHLAASFRLIRKMKMAQQGSTIYFLSFSTTTKTTYDEVWYFQFNKIFLTKILMKIEITNMDLPITILDLDTNKYHCYICTTSFNNIFDLKLHTSLQHSEIFKFIHTCDKCGISFSKNSNLKRHLMKNNCKEKIYKCRKCLSN